MEHQDHCPLPWSAWELSWHLPHRGHPIPLQEVAKFPNQVFCRRTTRPGRVGAGHRRSGCSSGTRAPQSRLLASSQPPQPRAPLSSEFFPNCKSCALSPLGRVSLLNHQGLLCTPNLSLGVSPSARPLFFPTCSEHSGYQRVPALRSIPRLLAPWPACQQLSLDARAAQVPSGGQRGLQS